MPIIIAPKNKKLVVDGVRGNDEVRRHLQSLGVVPGSEIALSGESPSGIICDVAGTRLAIDRKTATKISVRESD